LTHRGEHLHLRSSVRVQVEPEPLVVTTVHPSAVLRDRSGDHDEAYGRFVDDLRSARLALGAER
jgi:DNA polymerase